ncbi:PadR family transcriptional regulator [Actinocrispum wychmicini]|uniref:DNA-binding PadR family transcriptional regulator n=1 Tax=Actinocrispum wychmicini TaxID=1213861 RepID=A0A4R2JVV0_9PSEU|nr:PadR family transcriptional regulator [Actinocrispum wychmicini]TCO64601.1 DNA-binding PadR family transcriptional regulator [Actinocrispum wychmicini]
MSLRHAVLGLLAHGPASGYDLLKRFEVSLANVWSATQSQLYSELNRMADADLVEVAAEGPRGRKEYAITEPGLVELRHWMTEIQPERLRRSDMLLRVFFLDLVTSEEAIAYLRRQSEFAAERIAEFEAIRTAVADEKDSLAVYGRIALEWGIRQVALVHDWATWAEAEVRATQSAEEGP